METLMIAIIEDEEAHYSLMERALLKHFAGISIRHFPDAETFLDEFEHLDPDLIVTDYLMPGMNGVQFLEAIRQHKRDVPVIMTTGQGDENIAVQAMKLGVMDYVVKSSDFFSRLPAVVERVLREAGLRESLLEAEAALRASEERYRGIIENAPTAYFRVGRDGTWQYVNPQWERMHGYSLDEIVGKPFEITQPEEALEEARENMRRALSGEAVTGEFEWLRKDGSQGYHTFSIQPVYEGGEIVAVEGFINDITQRRRAEKQIRDLSHQLIKAQEIERLKISRDLHDKLAQELSTLKISLDTLFDDLPDAPAEKKERIVELSKMAQEIIMAVRNLAYDLRPAELDQLGLIRALVQYCEDFSARTGIDVAFSSAGIDEIKLDFDTEIALYRLIQEGLNNVRKHAHADNAVVKIVESFPHIILRIEDDGKGFDVRDRLEQASVERRMGVRSMEERVALLNGVMKIESRPGQGTRIIIEVPYAERTGDGKEDPPDC
jgi:PAS domain S-box-containing protein